MSEKKYTYSYSIREMQSFGKTKVPTPIASYLSNAMPPRIGDIIDPGEFTSVGCKQYEVIKVEIIPHANEARSTSEITSVNVFVEKVEKKKPLQGLIRKGQ